MILAILQARFSSSRLPGKVLKPILGKPMLLHQIERIQRSKKIDKLIVATSIDESDNEIEKMCVENNIEVFRGDLNNVLDRFYQCAKDYNPTHIVRLTGDCPVTDWQVIDQVIDYCLKGKYDHVSTTPKHAEGLDCEIMTIDALTKAWENATLPSEKEHVAYYINQRKDKFKTGSIDSDEDLSHHRWTVDEPEDFILIEKIYQNLYAENPQFLTQDILDLLKKNPEWIKINTGIIRNEGLLKSLETDKGFLKNV